MMLKNGARLSKMPILNLTDLIRCSGLRRNTDRRIREVHFRMACTLLSAQCLALLQVASIGRNWTSAF